MNQALVVTWASLEPVVPELLLITVAVALIGFDLFLPRQRIIMPWLTVLGCLTALAMVAGAEPVKAFGGMFVGDGYAKVFKCICLGSVLLTTLMSEHFQKTAGMQSGEFYYLMLLSTVGMLVMASAGDFMVLYLGLELMALPLYAMVGLHKKDGRTSEAAIKYFLMGGFASALLLLGLSLVYGLTGTTSIPQVTELITRLDLEKNPALLAALALMLAGLGFKVAAAPFHLWTPDVYEGAPTIVTTFMSVGPKAAGFAILGRAIMTGMPQLHDQWGPLVAVLAILTMAAGNITALCQTNLKRMLAYSSIAHAGYALLGLLGETGAGMAATMSYLCIYLFMNTGAFAILMVLARRDNLAESLEDCRGLATRDPLAAALMLVFLFSLIGIPPTGGFMGKFYLLQTAFTAGYTLTVLAAVVFSAISAYFYLRVVRLMYMAEGQNNRAVNYSPGMLAALTLCLLGVLGTGIFPGSLLAWTSHLF